MIEDLTDTVTAAASYITVIHYLIKMLLWLVPEIKKSLKHKRKTRRKK